MTAVPNRSAFENSYAGQPPWDIGKPQKPFIDVADRITGTVLDAGCGTGDTALFFAGRGYKVTGIDFIEEAINLMCFSDEEPGEQGPRRVSKNELHAAFAEGWVIESIEPTRAEVRPDFKDLQFSEGGPKAWFVVVRRQR
jgi:SAM-dependent methyltransferase